MCVRPVAPRLPTSAAGRAGGRVPADSGGRGFVRAAPRGGPGALLRDFLGADAGAVTRGGHGRGFVPAAALELRSAARPA